MKSNRRGISEGGGMKKGSEGGRSRRGEDSVFLRKVRNAKWF